MNLSSTMNTNTVTTMVAETPCESHEQQIQENSKKIAKLESKSDYKENRINELIEDNKRIEAKIDKLTDTVNDVIVNSIKDDNDLNNRVIALETQIRTQNDVIENYKEEQRKQRDEDRQKANQRLNYVAIGLTILTIILAYVIPYFAH